MFPLSKELWMSPFLWFNVTSFYQTVCPKQMFNDLFLFSDTILILSLTNKEFSSSVSIYDLIKRFGLIYHPKRIKKSTKIIENNSL